MSAALDDTTQYRLLLHAAAMAYISRGWAVVPISRIEYDAQGHKHVTRLIQWQKHPEQLVRTPEQVERWFGLTGRADGIAIATGPSGLLMVDEDAHKDGYAGAELPSGGWREQHGGRGGAHIYFANPEQQRSTAGALGRGVDTRGDGGLAYAAPTRCYHADGRVTQWVADRPYTELPRPEQLPAGPAAVRRSRDFHPVAVDSVETITVADGQRHVQRWREAWLASVAGQRHDTLMKFAGTYARYLFAAGEQPHDVYAVLEEEAAAHPDSAEFATVEKDLQDAVDYARKNPWVFGEPEGLEARFAPPDPGRPAERSGVLPTLSGEFWQARPVLATVRDAAWARRLAPDAVLHAVLARLAAGRRSVIRIDSGIEDSSLNYFAAIIGASGAGKSRAWRLAGRLLHLDPDACPARPLGSGEGVAEAFMGVVSTVDPQTMKPIRLRTQVRRNVLFELDEGQALTAMLQRSGATIGPALRSAWSGAVLGQQNADAERNRRVTDYSTGLVAGFQPDAMQALIEDTHTGMPQRFSFVAAVDPSLPKERPQLPAELPVDLRGVLEGEAANPFAGGVLEFGTVVSVPEEVTTELDAALLAVGTGAATPAELDSQKIAMMLRLAGLLALLEGRFAVSTEDWQLAGELWAVSAAVRDALVVRAVERAEHARERSDEQYADRQARAAAAVGGVDQKVERIATRLARHVHGEGGLTLGAARQVLAGRDRKWFGAAVELAESRAWLAASDDKLTPGSVRPQG